MTFNVNVSKSFGEHIVFKGLSLAFDHGKIYSILGPTGCGKTTLLNIISEIEKPTEGEVKIPNNYKLNYLLQENTLLPWRSLIENIRLGLEIQNNVNATKEKAMTEYIERFGLNGFSDYYPDALSGGMKQRTALIRCLITEPDILLMDEAWTGLDFEMKLKVQKEVLAYQKQKGATIIMVTHDIEDAIALSDEIIILAEKPTIVKSKMRIDLGLSEKDPVLTRELEKFPTYFSQIWKELKYMA